MKARYHLPLGCLLLAACEAQEPRVVVSFDQPFPAGEPDLPGFLRRDQRRYVVPGSLSGDLLIAEKLLLQSRRDSGRFAGAFLDSVGIPRYSGQGRGGQHYEVQALAADSFRVRVEAYDTLLNLSDQRTQKLRRYHGWYYLSTAAPEDSTKWDVQRLGILKGSVVRQVFNPDSLRVLALDPAIVQRHHYRGQLLIRLAPRSRQAIKQVSDYNGLWLNVEEYLASVLGSSQTATSQ